MQPEVDIHRDSLHVQVELVGQEAQGQGSAGSEWGDVHIGDEVIIFWNHLKGEMRSETIAS